MLQRVEQAERDAQAPITQIKVKGGRTKAVKMKNETLPTPQGRRVVPRVTSAMKVQAVKKGGVRKGKGKVSDVSRGAAVLFLFFFFFLFVLLASVLVCLKHIVFLQSDSEGSLVMKMEFGDEETEAGDLLETGLAARLSKKPKKEPKEKGIRRKMYSFVKIGFHFRTSLQFQSVSIFGFIFFFRI